MNLGILRISPIFQTQRNHNTLTRIRSAFLTLLDEIMLKSFSIIGFQLLINNGKLYFSGHSVPINSLYYVM